MADYSRLLAEQASLMNTSTLPVNIDGDVENAETDGRSININASFMGRVESAAGEDGVRFVLAHELGHSHNGMSLGGQDGEFAADSFATRSVALAGGTFESISAVFGMLSSVDSVTHPASGRRSVAAATQYEKAHGQYVKRELADDDIAKNVPAKTRGRDLKV